MTIPLPSASRWWAAGGFVALGATTATIASIVNVADATLWLLAPAFLTLLLAAPAGLRRGGYAVGWLGALTVWSFPRAGDVLIHADAGGYTLLITGLVAVTVTIATIPKPDF